MRLADTRIILECLLLLVKAIGLLFYKVFSSINQSAPNQYIICFNKLDSHLTNDSRNINEPGTNFEGKFFINIFYTSILKNLC